MKPLNKSLSENYVVGHFSRWLRTFCDARLLEVFTLLSMLVLYDDGVIDTLLVYTPGTNIPYSIATLKKGRPSSARGLPKLRWTQELKYGSLCSPLKKKMYIALNIYLEKPQFKRQIWFHMAK